MGTISLEANLGVTPDALWDHMKNFGEVSGFLDVISESTLVDGDSSKRVCNLADGTVLNESLLHHDHETRTLKYSITEGLPVTAHEATMSVEDVGDGRSIFRWVTESTVADGAPDGFHGMFEGMLAGEVAKLEQRWP
ncbi:MAG: SRPBCC family protein [Acidimicrobiia bacterium]|nr:SRPBCC family protein [Acidimicrobiia bacterium]